MAINAGSVSIMAELDLTSLKRGIAKLSTALGKVEGKTGGFKADLGTIASLAGTAAFNLAAVAVSGAAAMMGLASMAPAVAGSMAKIKVSIERIIRTLGREFKPVFQFLAEGFKKLAEWVDKNSDKIGFFASVVKGVISVVTTLAGWLLKAAWNVGKFIGNFTFDAVMKIKEWWDSITGAISGFFSKIKDAIRGVVDFIGNISSSIWGIITKVFDFVAGAVSHLPGLGNEGAGYSTPRSERDYILNGRG